MPSNSAELDPVIEQLDSALASLPAHSAERSVVSVKLVTLLLKRYLEGGGTDEDRIRAEELSRGLMGDRGLTAQDRQRVSLLLPIAVLMRASPAGAMRQRGGRPDIEALRLAEAWQESADPAAAAVGMQEAVRLLGEVPELEALPTDIRSQIEAMRLATELSMTAWKGDGSGAVTADLLDRLAGAAAEMPDHDPGRDLLRALVAWLRLPDPRSQAEGEASTDVAEPTLEIVDNLPSDHLLAPMLRLFQAQAMQRRGELGGDPAGLLRAAEILQQTFGGMHEDHPSHEEVLHTLAGVLLAAAAFEPSDERVAMAEQAVAEVLSRSQQQAGEADGADLFLQAMLELLRSRRADDHAGVMYAVEILLRAIEQLQLDHPLRPAAIGQLGAVLADRHLLQGLLEDAESSTLLLHRAIAAAKQQMDSGVHEESAVAYLRCLEAVTRVTHGMRVMDTGAIDSAVEALESALSDLPPRHILRTNLELVLAIGALTAASGRRNLQAVRSELDVIEELAQTGVLAGVGPGPLEAIAAAVRLLDRLLNDDPNPDAMMEHILGIEAALALPSTLPELRIGLIAMLGNCYLIVAERTGDGDACKRAVTHLEDARRLLDDGRASVLLGSLLRDLAKAYRIQGNPDQARHAALEALQLRAGDVLMQSSIAHAMVTARGAAVEAIELARWCVEDGDIAAAAGAFELGRGLTLHASTSALEVPELLAQVGRSDLAHSWQEHSSNRRTELSSLLTLPLEVEQATDFNSAARTALSDVRHEVLQVLRKAAVSTHLFTPPTVGDVAAALRRVSLDALVYVLPGDKISSGYLLIVPANDDVAAVQAPGLRIDEKSPIMKFLQEDDEDSKPWRESLDELCDWAGTAVIEPLIRELASFHRGDTPRIVLVAAGALGAVPWPAARRRSRNRGVRYACQDLQLSTAASARQLLDVASRIPLPLDLNPVLICDPIGNPDTDPKLAAAVEEVLALKQTFYPMAEILGDVNAMREALLEAAGAMPVDPSFLEDLVSGPSTPENVLRRLPGQSTLGASLLHFSCHASTAETPEESQLHLTQPLAARKVLEYAAGRGVDSPGPTVVLSACTTDVATIDFDEALTLATAFLGAGAVTVVGSHWRVEDHLTSVLMFAFHHFLAEGSPPAAALRAAQLWMLNPAKADLPSMPGVMRADSKAAEATDISIWAAFGHHGW